MYSILNLMSTTPVDAYQVASVLGTLIFNRRLLATPDCDIVEHFNLASVEVCLFGFTEVEL